MRLRFASTAAAFALALSALGCVPPDEISADDLGPTLDDHELMQSPDDRELDPEAKVEPKKLPLAHLSLERLLLTPERMAMLPEALRKSPQLAHLAVSRAIEDPIDYQGGVYGLNGVAKVFAASSAKIPDDTRLYWVMVKVLSEKYGCFMTSKTRQGAMTRVTCRDKRHVVFWTTRGEGWVQFLGRQFDKDGYEIVVRKRQIVRLGNEASL